MKPTDNGYRPEPGFLASMMDSIPELRHDAIPDFQLHEYDPLLDSANMRPANWLEIAKDIYDHYDQYDGFIVMHGTDTMAYTASALPLLLKNLAKPVILTGSQIPLCEVRNDARENLITSLLVAANENIPEVMICFGGFLLRGCRSKKVAANGFDAFQSPNYPPLGTIGSSIEIHRQMIRSSPQSELELLFEEDLHPKVAAFRLFPGIDHAILENLFQPPLKGIVIEAFGVGNAPSNDKRFLQIIQEATDRGVIVVVCTQCNKGRVALDDYEAGNALKNVGAISGSDMTVEAALAKLYSVLNLRLPIDETKLRMQQDWVGEIS